MPSLSNRKPKDTFKGLLKVGDGGLNTTLVTMEDGDGNATPIKLGLGLISIHDLLFPVSGASAGKVLTVSANGTSLEWKTPSGGSQGSAEPLPDSATYQYNQDGTISVVTEIIGGETKTTSYAYSVDGRVESVTTTYQGSTRVETYTYQNGKVASMTASTF